MQRDHRHPHASPAPPWDFLEKGAWKLKHWLPKQIWKNSLSIHRATLPQKIESLNPSFLKIVNISFGVWSLHFISSWLEAWVACLKPSSFGNYQDGCWILMVEVSATVGDMPSVLRWFEHILLCNSWCKISAKSFYFIFSPKCCLWCSWAVTSCLRFSCCYQAWGTVFQMKRALVWASVSACGF